MDWEIQENSGYHFYTVVKVDESYSGSFSTIHYPVHSIICNDFTRDC